MHFACPQLADATDAETGGDGQLAGIDDIAAATQRVIENLEIELLIGGHLEGDDDRRLHFVRQQRLEPQPPHAVDEDFAVAGVSRMAALGAALGVELVERLIEGVNHVGRRREPPLAVLFHRRPLVVKVEAQRVGVALALFQRRPAEDGETHPWYALQAFVGRRHHAVEGNCRGVERQGAEGTHGVDDEAALVFGGDPGNVLDRVEDPRRGLAINRHNMGDGRIRFQCRFQVVQVGRGVLGGFQENL